jgi:hypothetical protein
VLAGKQAERPQRFHVEPPIRQEPGPRLKGAQRGRRARPKLAIDSASIKSVASEKHLRPHDHVPL